MSVAVFLGTQLFLVEDDFCFYEIDLAFGEGDWCQALRGVLFIVGVGARSSGFEFTVEDSASCLSLLGTSTA